MEQKGWAGRMRLTKRYDNGIVMTENAWLRDVLQKLAAYEDTGYSPLEIKSLEGEWNAMRKVVDSYRAAVGKVEQLPRWISVTERLPEECEDLDLHEDMMIRFTSVWCCDANTGTINVRNRFQQKITGIQFLDQNIQDTDWHWSNSWWEPTHWMPIAPLPEPLKEE